MCPAVCCRASTFAYLRENHNSVLGMREYALEAGGLHWLAQQESGEYPALHLLNASALDAKQQPRMPEVGWCAC
jgi:hypothetical protein